MKRNNLHISRAFIFLLFILGISACSDDDTIQETEVKNRIEAIGLGDEGRYKFEYFNKFTFVQPQVLTDGVYRNAGNGLEITNFDNKIEIRFSTGRGVQGRLFVSALVEDEKIIKVQRAFESGTTYTYNFEYTPNNIRIVLEFDADGPLLDSEASIIEFGDYKLDDNGNVIELLKYRNFDNPPTELDL